MKLKIRNKNEIKNDILKNSIEDMFSQNDYFSFTWEDDRINKSSFHNSAFSNWIDKNDLFRCCLIVLSDKKELKHYKALYKELLPNEKSDYGNVEYDILNNMELYGKILNFIKPLLAEKLEINLIYSDFLKKCTWLDDFKIQYKPYIEKFKTLKIGN